MGKRLSFRESVRISRRIMRGRDALLKTFAFTSAVPAYLVIDAIERRWGRDLPVFAPDFRVTSLVDELPAIVAYGCVDLPSIFSARIDFESRDPAAGTLRFVGGDAYAPGTEAAALFCAEFARLLRLVSPGAELRELDDLRRS